MNILEWSEWTYITSFSQLRRLSSLSYVEGPHAESNQTKYIFSSSRKAL